MKLKCLLLITILFVCACVAQSPNAKRKVASNSSSTTTETATATDDASIYWYTNSNVGSSVLIDQSLQTEMSLRGTQVHNYLASGTNSTPLYCLVINFNSTGVKKQLRARAIPSNVLDISTGILRKVFRVNFSLTSENSNTCQGTVASVASADSAYSLADLSSTLASIFYSTSVTLYKSTGSSISNTSLIGSSSINLASLVFKVNPVFTNPTTNSCTNSSCQAKGYNCCIEGQCVNDGTERPNASSQSNYSQAKADVAANPYNFIYWTNVYYVCSNIPHPGTASATATPNASATADSLLSFLIKEYYCIEGSKKTPADYSSCSPANSTGLSAVKLDLWSRCGCSASPTAQAPNDAATLCPNYGLTLIKDSNGNITRVECDVPTNVEATPFQNLSLGVSSRAAPHRFFKSTDGNAVDTQEGLLSLTASSSIPEGTEFSYTDEINKLLPNSGSYNMNSVLGQFSVSLSGAIPARMIEVEYDQTYIISPTSGYYSPCPKCAKDSWFASFTSAPKSQLGIGLQSSGYTTSRDSYSNNMTLGNYEDTIFGRACWVPPTMIPFSHQKNTNVQTQRLNRLKTQAAYYINGYKRDWYGFNYGALIASFDGVRWFAVGNSRRVTSTSTKLFLAINAPFADLSENSEIVVSVIANNTHTTASAHDFDPSLALSDARQNQGASCQAWHQCKTDSDCISKLGWEYACADVSSYKTYWPDFDAYGNEKSEALVGSFNTILQSMLPEGSSTKRCVYRGAGAPCKSNFTTISSAEEKKLFTCAPNFYCATSSSDAFNLALVRTPNYVGDILYGQEANVLGRPLSYVTARDYLSSDIISNIKKNASLITTSETSNLVSQADFGLCRPGKKLSGVTYNPVTNTSYHNKLEQHKARDTSYRTDYISQIGSCDSSLTGPARVITCPLIGEDGNYSPVNSTGYYTYGDSSTTSFTTAKDVIVGLTSQNTCGYEQRKQVGTNSYVSPFNFLELAPISALGSLAVAGVAKDACLRRPGSVCHTDLDCSPNKLHAVQADTYDISYFGNTDAERRYWQESLVCGQGDSQPNYTDSNYSTYDVTQNRCCREVGKDFSMYTQSNSTQLTPSLTDEDISNLKTASLSSANPAATGRYSRYSVVDVKAGSTGAATEAYAEYPHVTSGVTPKEFQWKTIADTGKKTCCGGGWIRKFSDGSHDWSVTNRFNYNYENFACLNYNNELYNVQKPSELYTNNNNIGRYYDKLCFSPDMGACAQRPITEVDSYEIVYPRSSDEVSAIGTMDTSQDPSVGPTSSNYNEFVPYLPTAYFPTSSLVLSAGAPGCAHGPAGCYGGYGTGLKSEGPYNYLKDPLKYYATVFYLPSYMNRENITAVNINYYSENHASGAKTVVAALADSRYCNLSVTGSLTTNPFHEDFTFAAASDPFPSNAFCFGTDPSSGLTFMAIRGCTYGQAGCTFWGGWTYNASTVGQFHAGVEIQFRPMNTRNYIFKDVTVNNKARVGLTGANALYYLTKLGRLELAGIPQIFYEPIYCNSDRSKLVDGIFNLTTPNRTNFIANSFSYSSTVNGRTLGQIYDSTLASTATDASTYDTRTSASGNPRIAFMDKLATGQIFSDVEFTCCLPLGSKTSAASKCCSNYAFSESSSTSLTCGLPPRTDLSVYFNRFVSSEGSGTIGGLVDDDFIPETGEPKLRASTYDKLSALGKAYCSSGSVRQGAAFGKFFGEPNQGSYSSSAGDKHRYFGILDSNADYNSTDDSGYAAFSEGYHWNHHLYCE